MSTPDYKKENYDQILFRVKKGKKGEYQQAAQDLGIKFWALIQAGVEEYIQNHGGESLKPAPMTGQPTEKLSAADKKLIENFNALSPKSQKALREIISELVEKKGGD